MANVTPSRALSETNNYKWFKSQQTSPCASLQLVYCHLAANLMAWS